MFPTVAVIREAQSAASQPTNSFTKARTSLHVERFHCCSKQPLESTVLHLLHGAVSERVVACREGKRHVIAVRKGWKMVPLAVHIAADGSLLATNQAQAGCVLLHPRGNHLRAFGSRAGVKQF